MSEAFKRAGVLYGRLGLDTPHSLIERRYPGVEAAAKALTLEQLPDLVKVAFGVSRDAKDVAFLEHFRSDPTFDVRPADNEAALLAISVADYAMTEDIDLAGQVAPMIVTASMGGMRPPRAVKSDILTIADQCLTARQGKQSARLSLQQQRIDLKSLTDAIKTVGEQNPSHGYLPQIMQAVVAAFDQVVGVVDSASKQTNSLLAHIAKLEGEMQTYWWASGGWSAETNSFFRDLPPVKAAIRAGWELAGTGAAALGLYAAPALLRIVLERGRTEMQDVSLVSAATGAERLWRKTNYPEADIEATGCISLLPISALFAYSAAAEDESDWKPRFKRNVGIDPEMTINPIDLGVQVYREQLVRKLLKV